MAYKMSLDYPLAKRFLKAMDNLIDPEIADYSNSVGKQIIMLEQCEIYNECHGEYAKATVEKLDQLYKEWHDLMLQLKNCKNSIANKVEQIHAYDMEEQAKQEQQAKPSSYQPVAGIVAASVSRYKNYSDLNRMVGQKIDTSGYGASYSVNTTDGKTRSFNRPQCTWYAAARYEEINGKGSLTMSKGTANGKEWYQRVDPNRFDVNQIKSKETINYSVIKSNSLACTTSNGWGDSSKNGHVVYIEGVAKDEKGKTYVFFSDGGPGYASKGKLGEVKKWEIERFAKIYDYVMTAK